MPRKTSPRLSEALKEYLEVRSTYLAATTLDNDASVLRRFVAGVGDRQAHTLSHQTVEKWFAAEAKRLQPRSFNKARSRVMLFLGFCARRGWVDTDPSGEIRPRKVVRRERLRLSPAELLELPGFARTSRDRCLLVLAANTALRGGEIRDLRVSDVDLAGGWLHVRISKSALEDVMPISSELETALRGWLREYEDEFHGLEPDWYLFPRRGSGHNEFAEDGTVLRYVYGGHKPTLETRNLPEIVQRALIEAGHVIEPGEGIHTLRRSVARAFFDRAVSGGYDAALRATSALLHHSSSQVTEIYLGLTSEKLSRDEILHGRSFLGEMAEVASLSSKAS